MDRLQIIIPCFNEANRFPLEDYSLFLNQSTDTNISFLFVNDGSSDNTIEILQKLSDQFQQVTILNLNKNVGKAEAIRQGVLSLQAKQADFIGYFDADLAAPLNEIENLNNAKKSNQECLFVLGARIKLLGSTDIKRNLFRHYIGRIFATIVGNMLKLPIYDTQCGAKLIRKDVALSIFESPFTSKWLFDVELLFRVKNQYEEIENKIIEVPLKKWEDKSGSKIKLSYYFQAPIDLIRIYFRYN
ncbi:MAG: glycosyltransferase [Vicingaceae bacterium]